MPSSKYMDMESSPSLLPSDESSGGSNTESFHEDEPPRLGPLRNMRRSGPFHREELPRLAPRKNALRGETQDSPQATTTRRKTLPGSLDDSSVDEMRRVLREVGAIGGSPVPRQKKGKGKGWGARRPKEGSLSTKEPVWKRRLRSLKSSLVPEHAAAEPTVEGEDIDQQQEDLRPRIGLVKSVSFDDKSLNFRSAADDFSATKKKNAQTPEEKPNSFQRAGSSFSDFFRKVTDEDLFSLDTPSFWSDQTSITTEGDDTTVTSYRPRIKSPKMRCKKPASCGVLNQEQMRNYACSSCDQEQMRNYACRSGDQETMTNNYGCSSSKSVVDDLRLVADLLIRDATCHTFMSDEAIPQRRGNTENSLHG
jgi:hypothetical protein